MAGILEWLGDSGLFGGGGAPLAGGMGEAGDTSAMSMPPPASAPMPAVQQTGADGPPPQPYPAGGDPMAGSGTGNGPGLPLPSGTDPMTAGGPTPNGPGLPPAAMPAPQPRPTAAPGAPPAAAPPSAAPGPPTQLGPGLGVGTQPNPATMPGNTWLTRAFGITPDQGSQIGSGLAAGLKSVGDNWNKPGLAAFAGSAGSAMEGSQKRGDTQQKQAADYLGAAIKARQANDEAGYKQNYLKYLAAKLQADTDKAASKDATANKNDTPTQLYLNAQRLVQSDPEVRDASKALGEARKNGSPDEVAKAQATLQQIIGAKQVQHYGALGLNPQTAAQLGKQPGNARENPIDAGKMGITKDNIAKKLQPGQYFTNPSDGQVYQYKGPQAEGSKAATPDKPSNPEPADPMNKSAISTGATAGSKSSGASSDDGED